MKNLKRVLGLFLCIAMMLSLAACGAKPSEEYFKIVDTMQELNDGSYEIMMTMKSDDFLGGEGEAPITTIKMGLNGDLSVTEDAIHMNLLMGINDSEPANLTDVIIADNKLYVNLEGLVKGVLSLDYIKESAGVTDEELKTFSDAILASLGDTKYVYLDLNTDGAAQYSFMKYAQVLIGSDFYKGIQENVKATVLGFEPEVITKNKDKTYSMVLTDEQMNTVATNEMDYMKANTEAIYSLMYSLAEANDGQLAMNIYEAFESTIESDKSPENATEALAILADNKDSIVSLIKDSFNDENTTTGTEDIPDCTLSNTVGKTKDGYKVHSEISLKEENIELSLDYAYAKKAVSITAPENATNLEDVMTSLLGGFMGSGTEFPPFEDDGSGFDDGWTDDPIDSGYEPAIDDNPDDDDIYSSIGEDEWRYEYDISLEDVKYDEIRTEIEKYMNKYSDWESTIDFSYGEYELYLGQDNNTLGLIWDYQNGKAENNYLTNVYACVDYYELKNNDFEKDVNYVIDMLDELIGKSITYDEFMGSFADSDDQYKSGNVYDEDGSFYISYSPMDYGNVRLSYYFE